MAFRPSEVRLRKLSKIARKEKRSKIAGFCSNEVEFAKLIFFLLFFSRISLGGFGDLAKKEASVSRGPFRSHKAPLCAITETSSSFFLRLCLAFLRASPFQCQLFRGQATIDNVSVDDKIMGRNSYGISWAKNEAS